MQNCYRGYQSHLKHLLTWLTERLFLYPVSVQRKRPDCSAEQPPSDVLFIRFISHWNVYGAFTCIQALKWMSCTWLQRLWPPAVCVLLLSFSPQCRSMEARGRQTGSHSPLQCAIVQPGKKKNKWKSKTKKWEKERAHTCPDKSFRCCFSSSFNILQRSVCAHHWLWPCAFVLFFLSASTSTWKPEGLKAIKPLNHK